MAATISVIAGTMKAGDHCVITNCSYGGTNRACRTMFTDMGMTFDFIDFTDLANIEAHIKPNTKLIFSESPANPTLTLTDLSAVSVRADPTSNPPDSNPDPDADPDSNPRPRPRPNADPRPSPNQALAKRKGLLHVCDSTFATPVIQVSHFA